jgi:hypothetical protein
MMNAQSPTEISLRVFLFQSSQGRKKWYSYSGMRRIELDLRARGIKSDLTNFALVHNLT